MKPALWKAKNRGNLICMPKEINPSDTRSPTDFLAEFDAAASLADKQGWR